MKAVNRAFFGFFVLSLWSAACFGLGFAIGGAWWSVWLTSPTPIELSLEQREDKNFRLEQRTIPMTVRLEIEDEQGFDPGVIAYTMPYKRPCEIHLRAGMVIDSKPRHWWADFRDPQSGEIIAHELLHCLRGTWHP